jgi:Tol biopolymer transport system component
LAAAVVSANESKARGTERHVRFTSFSPDGKAVLYTSDLTTHSNMYLVEVGKVDELPDLQRKLALD